MFVSHPESRAPGLAYIGWKAARFLSFLVALPILVPWLVLVATYLAVKGIGWAIEGVRDLLLAPYHFFDHKMCERARDIRAIRRREGLPMRK
jgi:hypothetical protein